MIPAKHTWFHDRFFRWYTNYRIGRNFSQVQVKGDQPPSGEPLLLVSNHFSWWDGFFMLWLNNRYLHRRFHVMMLEDQLSKNMILNKTGAFSIQRGSRDALQSIAYARKLLTGEARAKGKHAFFKNAPALVLMYPQGEIESQHTSVIRFQSGIEHIVKGIEGQITLLMTVVLTDYFSAQKPSLTIYLKNFALNVTLDVATLEQSFNEFISDCRAQQLPPKTVLPKTQI